MKVYTEKNRIIKSWCNEPEQGALDQAKNLSQLPFLFKHVALMPDTHQGYGMPIGGVIACKGVVIPNAVGVDIGCGMCAIKTSIKVDEINKHLKTIMGKIRKVVPVGFNHHKEKQDEICMPFGSDGLTHFEIKEKDVVFNEYKSALKQIGTLGGGNHFIEIQKDTEDNVWIMIHSGSRNLGFKVAKYYNEVAKKLNERWYSSVPKEHDLAFLPIETQEAKAYMKEMEYCVDFAFASRKLMMENIIQILINIGLFKNNFSGLIKSKESLINIAHNYARFENHFGKNVIVHRKGATSAKLGEIGIIPGSQGTKSYIVRGLGNKDSFESCSHGAGRKMGRKESCRRLNLQDEINKLDEQGIVHGIRTEKDLDEASGAYKDINVVMEEQKDLVEIVTELTPIGVIKG